MLLMGLAGLGLSGAFRGPLGMLGSGFRVQGLGFRVGLRVEGLGFRV